MTFLALLLLIPVLNSTNGAEDPPRSAQEDPKQAAPEPQVVHDGGQTIITANRTQERPIETPWAADVIDAAEIRRRSYRTTPQILRDTPGVLVQETAHGQGSPYLRGFTGFRNLFLVDGVRLNNSVFRDGPNQYWNTVDAFSLERLEVVKGPSSVLYGSDAIGGTVNAITTSPWALIDERGYGGAFHYRISSAESSHVGRLESALGLGENTAFAIGVTGKSFGDVHGGRDVGTQPETGYDELDLDLKLEHWLGDDLRLSLLHQTVRQNDVPRTHRTVHGITWEGLSNGSDLQRDLDQARRLTYVRVDGSPESLGWGDTIDHMNVTLSWQETEELRDRIRSSSARQLQGFEVSTLGLSTVLASDSSIGELSYGFELYHDSVDSFSTSSPIQGPVADDATYSTLGVFLQDRIQTGERTELTLGTRFSHAAADADSVRDPVSGLRTDLDESWSDWVSSARLTYWLEPDEFNLFAGVSQGFRAPNLSDLTRFDSARTNEFEIASPDLDPESFISYEIGAKVERDGMSAQAALFYTDVSDAIVRFPTGNTNAMGEFEITKDNVGDGFVTGIELEGSLALNDAWSVFGGGTLMDGELDTFPTSAPQKESEPIDRLMPLTLQAGLRFEPDGHSWFEASLTWADDADELSTRDKSDTSRIPVGGTPGYAIVGVRGGIEISDRLELFLALENLTDEDYRVHGSGVNRPGRGVYLGLRAGL